MGSPICAATYQSNVPHVPCKRVLGIIVTVSCEMIHQIIYLHPQSTDYRSSINMASVHRQMETLGAIENWKQYPCA